MGKRKVNMLHQSILSHLHGLFWWLTFAAIVLPIVGGLAAWGAWRVGEKLSEPRTINSEQQTRFVKALKPYKTTDVYISFEPGYKESELFQKQWIKVL